ncbi:MAG: quinolinate synthase NadA [Planctomycetia bacterium]|nr:quinolinate synthase NadA [Planctomycetia bacterium]
MTTAPLTDYLTRTDEDLTQELLAAKKRLGKRLLILGHYYQKDELFRLADIAGDSYQLSAKAAVQDAEVILFCGVHFMAETADILVNAPERVAARHGRRVDVLLPDPDAGCTMAEMATAEQAEDCWRELAQVIDVERVVPITYVNSPADLKAFCGRHGGAACTSSNASAVLDWAFSKGERVLFLPDQHLGRNMGQSRGLSQEQMILWRHGNSALYRELAILGQARSWNSAPLGGNSRSDLEKARLILWDGFCTVHQRFTLNDIARVRRDFPDAKIIVHPECSQEVVSASDLAGSTAFILRAISDSPKGACWAVGTEWHMVQRLIKDFPEQTIINLAAKPCSCDSMNRITLANLAWTLACWEAGSCVGRVSVADSIRSDALACLAQMLACPGTKS